MKFLGGFLVELLVWSWWTSWWTLSGLLGGLLVGLLVDSWWTSWWTLGGPLGGLLGVVLAYIASMLHAHNINIYIANFGISISWILKPSF